MPCLRRAELFFPYLTVFWAWIDFPLRGAEYLFGIGRRYGRIPWQVVLYVGQARLRWSMASSDQQSVS